MNLYEAALKEKRSPLKKWTHRLWTIVGLSTLLYLTSTGPFSAWVFHQTLEGGFYPWAVKYIGTPFVMIIRAVFFVETLGYMYHRWFQHVSFWTRRAHLIRKSQRYHWIHHMIIYPIGHAYQKTHDYIAAEKGIAWSWVIPGVLFTGLFVSQHGWSLGSVVFIGAVAFYAKGIVSNTHSRFHMVDHSWSTNSYFRWLEEIHLLHHWDQRRNFTIVHPAMDILFGTYLSPKKHREELRIAREDKQLTASDMMNWRYLLLEASPTEYAAFISEAKHHPRSVEKLNMLLEVLAQRMSAHAEEEEPRLLHQRASNLLTLCT